MKTQEIAILGLLAIIILMLQELYKSSLKWTRKALDANAMNPLTGSANTPWGEIPGWRVRDNCHVTEFEFRKLLAKCHVGSFTITSQFRTKEHNDDVHGSKNSQHMAGLAIDFTVQTYQNPGESFYNDFLKAVIQRYPYANINQSGSGDIEFLNEGDHYHFAIGLNPKSFQFNYENKHTWYDVVEYQFFLLARNFKNTINQVLPDEWQMPEYPDLEPLPEL